MPKRISDVFSINPDLLKEHGVFNGFVDIDSKFYIDPRLLSRTSVYELRNSYEQVTDYFDDILNDIEKFCLFLDKSRFDSIVSRLQFSETPLAGLGYSINHNGGKGIGNTLASDLATTIIKIVRLGIIDPAIFEIAGLFEPGIGADRISDMIICILLPNIALFSSRIARSLKLPISSKPTLINGKYFNDLPCYSNSGVLFVPEDILTDIPLGRSWTDTDTIATHNQKLREDVNKMLGKSWAHLTTLKDFSNKKPLLKKIILEHPELLDELLKRYKNKSAHPYDFKNDPKEEFKWHDRARHYAIQFPLQFLDVDNISGQEIATIIIKHFEKLIRSGLASDFHYRKSGDPKKEEIGQLILLELLECYTKNTNLDVRYDHKTDTINLYKKGLPNVLLEIVLKFSSTQKVNEYYIERYYNQYLLFHDVAFIIVRTNRGFQVFKDLINLNNDRNKSDKLKFFAIDGTWRK